MGMIGLRTPLLTTLALKRRFSDVSLMCQRIGTTTLPLASTATRSASLPDLHGKAKFATVSGRRAQQQPRNLYKVSVLCSDHVRETGY